MNITSRFNWWLRKGEHLRELPGSLPKLVLYLFLVNLVGGIVSALFLGTNEVIRPAAQGLEDIQHMGLLSALEFLVGIPFVVEFIYRGLLLTIVLEVLDRRGWYDSIRGLYGVLAMVAISSIDYGYRIPSWNALSQTLAGVAYCIVFLRWSRFGTKIDDGFTAAWLLHIVFNTCVLGVSYLGVWILTYT